MFSPTLLTGEGYNQLIRKIFPPLFGSGFWDRVALALVAELYASKRQYRFLG
jgi:hypothetical protein